MAKHEELKGRIPDLMALGLRLVFVGINPGTYSARKGHYFARATNRFWPAFSRSQVSAEVRAGLGREGLGPSDDSLLRQYGIGFTDLVATPSDHAQDLSAADFQNGAQQLLGRIKKYQPKVACFHGVTAYRAFTRYALGNGDTKVELGPQQDNVGESHLFVVPNPSPANAHFTLADQIEWYDKLAGFMVGLE